jgi:hypothetical protein
VGYASSALAQAAASAQLGESALEPLAEVVIVASTPVHGAELAEARVAGSVQPVDAEHIHATHGATLADASRRTSRA